ncbi:Pr6Pr family membrane protein [Agromyces aerolatus]|uniref:Pr6Pr family membrane protein n=1 Tax=Agromyces sp. LY-1074 TaxID=3074080 RepID=UPI0028559A74|nr:MULTISPECIES: Pr6Pr family membrane protein [unclassified Agromyces]MDR5701214.1 Pr6Pr family membrane protein [Agromyces sp. LY-1074]MDR5706910.1 Pr6Pr family membrane protein [Agromyces sp. LY-1358]
MSTTRSSSTTPPAPQIDLRARLARWWFGTIAVVVAAALLIQIVLIFTGGQDVNSGESTAGESLATRFVRLFSFFTIQSNLFVLVTSIALAINVTRDGKLWRVIRLDALLGIIITGLVYETILAPLVHPEGWALAATIGFHYISPWATLIGWLIFGPRPRSTWLTTVLAFIWPLAWLVYTFVHGAVTGWYPYPFLDVATIGLADSLRNSGVILLIGIVIAVVLTLLDHHLPSLVKDRARTPEPAPDRASEPTRT